MGKTPMRRLLVLVMLAFSPRAFGGSSSPDSSVTASHDGRRILVMRSANLSRDNSPIATLPDGRLVNIRNSFPTSGVYDSRTLRPLWQVNWYAHPWDLLCSDDLQHVARIDRTGYRQNSALQFYDNGKLTRSYACTDLLTGLTQSIFLPYTTSGWHEQWYEHFDRDASGTEISLSTARRQLDLFGQRFDLGLQESYRFNMTTGSIESRGSSGRWVVWAYAVAALLLLIALAVTVRTLWRQVRPILSRRRRGFDMVVRNP